MKTFDFYEKETVEFVLPEWNIKDFDLYKWKIEIQSEKSKEKFYLNPELQCISLRIQKNNPLSVTATPVLILEDGNKTIFFKPAGALYPFDFDGSFNSDDRRKMALTWEKGFSAYLMQQLFKSEGNESTVSKYIHSFNWKKFNETILQKTKESLEDYDSEFFFTPMTSFLQSETQGNQKTQIQQKIYYNPWLLDYELIMEKISTKKFSSTNLNLKDCISANIVQEYQNNDFSCENQNARLSIKNPFFPPPSITAYSAYIPENKILIKNHIATIHISRPNLFAITDKKSEEKRKTNGMKDGMESGFENGMENNSEGLEENENACKVQCLIVKYSAAKNISSQLVFMPILVDEL